MKPQLWRSSLRRFLISVAAISVAATSLAVPAPAAAAFPGSNGLIAFQSSRADSNYDIWIMTAEGGGATRLTTDPAEDADPSFSPDGSKIAFLRYYAGGGDVYVMNADGSGQTLLAAGYDPAWMPDGRLSYAYRGDIWTMNADGTNQQLLIAGGSHPAWSPDGTKIAFVRGQNMFVAAADGSGAVQIAAYADDPSWDPDGSRIVFTRWAVVPGLAVVSPDGTGLANLTTEREDCEPAFSPDGTQIAFMSGGRADNYELFRMGPDGSGVVTRITYEFPAYDAMPDWQPAPPLPELSIADASVIEGNAGTVGMVFDVTLSKPSGSTVSVGYATADGTAGAPDEYAQTTGTVMFAPGDTTASITVPVVGDTVMEQDETFSVSLSGAVDATIADGDAIGTILDDDRVTPDSYILTISDATVKEKAERGQKGGQSAAIFVVRLNAPARQPVSVAYATVDGTAIAPADYESATGRISFGPGERQVTIHVKVQHDNLLEGDETFTVELSNPTGAEIVDGVGAATVVDDDPRPVADLGVSIVDPSDHMGGGKAPGGDGIPDSGEVVYVVNAWSHSRLATVHAVLTVTLPAGFTLTAVEHATCSVADDGGRTVITCPLSLADDSKSGRAHDVLLAIRAAPAATSGSYTATAAIALVPGAWAVDPRLADNASSAVTLVGPTADLAVSLGYKTSELWMVGVANYGPDAAAATVTVTLPEGLTFVSSSHATCAAVGSVVSCSLPPVMPGGERTAVGFSLQLQLTHEIGQYTVTASVEPAGAPLCYDPRPGNNQAARTVSIDR